MAALEVKVSKKLQKKEVKFVLLPPFETEHSTLVYIITFEFCHSKKINNMILLKHEQEKKTYRERRFVS